MADPGDEDGNDRFGGGFLLAVDGFDGQRLDDPSVRGLPRDGQIGVHHLGDYSRRNVIKLRKPDKLVRVEVPRGHYVCVRFLVSGAEGDSAVPVSLEYADGSRQTNEVRCDDFYDHPDGSRLRGLQRGVIPVRRGMDIWTGDALRQASGPTIFEVLIPTLENKELVAFELDPGRGRFVMHLGGVVTEGANDETTSFHLFAATGMRSTP